MSDKMWRRVKLSDIGSIIGGATPSTSKEIYYGGDIPWLTPKDLSNFHDRYIDRGERNITKEGLDSCSAQLLPAGSVLFSSRAPIGYVAIAENPIATNQGFKSVIPNPDKVDSLFLYYLLIYNKSNIEAMGSGTTFKEVSGATMKNIEVELPSLEEQKRIAGILGVLDDKIELNRRINANLEEQARICYQQSFIKASNSKWHNGYLRDLVNIKYGKDHKKLKNGHIPVYGSGGIMRYVDTFLYDKESVLIPRKGTLDNIVYLNTPFWSVDTMFYTVMKYEHIAKYVYFFLKSKNLTSMNAGSAVPSMTTEILNQLELIIPDEVSLYNYDLFVSPMFEKIRRNEIEIRTLSSLRDTLLPKLMNGEIEI